MQIAIIHHQYARKGGLESCLFDLIDGFLEQGDQITVFTYLVDPKIPQNPQSKIVQYQPRLTPPKMARKYFFIHHINKTFRRELFDLSLSLTRTANQDITICGGTHLGYLHRCGSAFSNFNIRHLLEISLEQKGFTKSPIIVAHSPSIAKEIENLYHINPNKIHSIYPPINTKKFIYADPKNKQTLAHKFGIDQNKITILFPSTGHKRKGYAELMAAMSMLKSSHIDLVVAGKPITHTKNSTNIRYLGFVDNMAELYAAVDFTILPAHNEPFGLVVMESVQCGTPVIISDAVGAKDLLTNNEAIFLGQVTPNNIVFAIKTAIEKKFNIPPNFAERKNLTIEQHIKAVKKLLINC
jgi:glycosyltransferase involved in cell wall biosynthesis